MYHCFSETFALLVLSSRIIEIGFKINMERLDRHLYLNRRLLFNT